MTRPVPVLALAVLIAAVAFALSPALSGGFAGFAPEQFPVVRDDWPVQPAGWAFSIWGVIFLWLIAGAAWGLLKAPRDPDWTAMRRPLLASLGLGAFWIAAANSSPILATVMIWAMAATAIAAMLRAGPDAAALNVRPVALYAGWLTAASGVGSGVVLGGYEILGAQAAALSMLTTVLVVAVVVQSFRPREWAYPLAVAWALSGVIATNLPSANVPVIALSLIGVAILAAGYWRKRSRPALQ